jgi:iron uptake system component EfeO
MAVRDRSSLVLRSQSGAPVLLPAGLLGALFCAMAVSTAPARPLDESAAQFQSYLVGQVSLSLANTQALRERIAAGDLDGAQRAWLAARSGWETAEIVTSEYFPDLDGAIDPWPDARTGFHAIEAKLFGAHQIDTLPEAEELVRNLTEFVRRLRTAMVTAQGILNGTAKLAYEIGDNKADGGESRFSGNSLAELGANIAGITAAYHTVFASSLGARDAKLAQAVEEHLERLQALVAVPTLKDLDQTELRKLSEILAGALRKVGQELGLSDLDLSN